MTSAADFSVIHPGKRPGKHAKGKGSPFTPPKRRKKLGLRFAPIQAMKDP
jgi:hypothetical protein